jgi:mannitol/fructose-specific phosphotransferase system IIA component (Ntr-type)
MERERLGSTGVGAGVAIPHGKVANLKNDFGCFFLDAVMNIIDFISADAVVPDFKASSKRQALQILGRKAADIAGLEQHLVMDVLMNENG